ncbi:hypothetical protein IID04_04680 [PVC group bacterium]|nr:hypothetical protein [PVC group bacterium]
MEKKERNIKAVLSLWFVVSLFHFIGGIGMYISNLFSPDKMISFLEYSKLKIGFGFGSLVLLILMFISLRGKDI